MGIFIFQIIIRPECDLMANAAARSDKDVNDINTLLIAYKFESRTTTYVFNVTGLRRSISS